MGNAMTSHRQGRWWPVVRGLAKVAGHTNQAMGAAGCEGWPGTCRTIEH
jgi:hypothetical protein